ncbi:unnamed protein product [Linum trigynum]|uniref:Uncharacterized protein n=1 Tax=Linum trigynum TaxID=586398 RepID=A0AAV2FNA4_9ROSI
MKARKEGTLLLLFYETDNREGTLMADTVAANYGQRQGPRGRDRRWRWSAAWILRRWREQRNWRFATMMTTTVRRSDDDDGARDLDRGPTAELEYEGRDGTSERPDNDNIACDWSEMMTLSLRAYQWP